MRPGDHRIRRLRILHVVECPRQCRGREARAGGGGDLFDRFHTLGRAQARALGHPDLPIAVIAHPFGLCTRDEVRQMAEQCVDDIAKLVLEASLS